MTNSFLIGTLPMCNEVKVFGISFSCEKKIFCFGNIQGKLTDFKPSFHFS